MNFKLLKIRFRQYLGLLTKYEKEQREKENQRYVKEGWLDPEVYQIYFSFSYDEKEREISLEQFVANPRIWEKNFRFSKTIEDQNNERFKVLLSKLGFCPKYRDNCSSEWWRGNDLILTDIIDRNEAQKFITDFIKRFYPGSNLKIIETKVDEYNNPGFWACVQAKAYSLIDRSSRFGRFDHYDGFEIGIKHIPNESRVYFSFIFGGFWIRYNVALSCSKMAKFNMFGETPEIQKYVPKLPVKTN